MQLPDQRTSGEKHARGTGNTPRGGPHRRRARRSGIEEVRFAFPKLRRFGAAAARQRVADIETRGKALLTHFDNDYTIYSHNQLYGVWKIARRGRLPKTRRSLRLALHTATHRRCSTAPRTSASGSAEELGLHPFLARIGPDLLSARAGLARRRRALAEPRFAGRSLAALYLDQHFLAGSGNYLRSEILFCAGLHPPPPRGT
jgi:endonuclease-8